MTTEEAIQSIMGTDVSVKTDNEIAATYSVRIDQRTQIEMTSYRDGELYLQTIQDGAALAGSGYVFLSKEVDAIVQIRLGLVAK
jgi:hypothetical protein